MIQSDQRHYPFSLKQDPYILYISFLTIPLINHMNHVLRKPFLAFIIHLQISSAGCTNFSSLWNYSFFWKRSHKGLTWEENHGFLNWFSRVNSQNCFVFKWFWSLVMNLNHFFISIMELGSTFHCSFALVSS